MSDSAIAYCTIQTNVSFMWQLCAAMMSWVGCLLKDSELFTLFTETS